MARIRVPAGSCSSTSSSSSEDAAARKRRELRDKLLRGEQVVVTQGGAVEDENPNPSQPAIRVPPGKLAASFYWYERDPQLFADEKEAMTRYFPQFRLERLDDGRMAWNGVLAPDNLTPGARWYLQVVYDHNHPNNSSYGGSIKVYSIEPDLDAVYRNLGGIPHILRDYSGAIYICTSEPGDFVATAQRSTTAASALSWAAKWIAAFELWLAGDLATAEFAGHRI